MNRLHVRLSVLFAFLAMIFFATQAEARDPNRVEGTVSGFGTSSVIIATQGGMQVEVQVNSATKIERNGRRVPLSAFKVGDRAQARLVAGSNLATKLEAVGP